MTDSRQAIRDAFIDALNEHVKELIHERTTSSSESSIFNTCNTQQRLEAAVDDVLNFVPEHGHHPRRYK
jgi:hypothetical protein